MSEREREQLHIHANSRTTAHHIYVHTPCIYVHTHAPTHTSPHTGPDNHPTLWLQPHLIGTGLTYVSGPISAGPAAAHMDFGEPDPAAYLKDVSQRGRDASIAFKSPASQHSEPYHGGVNRWREQRATPQGSAFPTYYGTSEQDARPVAAGMEQGQVMHALLHTFSQQPHSIHRHARARSFPFPIPSLATPSSQMRAHKHTGEQLGAGIWA